MWSDCCNHHRERTPAPSSSGAGSRSPLLDGTVTTDRCESRMMTFRRGRGRDGLGVNQSGFDQGRSIGPIPSTRKSVPTPNTRRTGLRFSSSTETEQEAPWRSYRSVVPDSRWSTQPEDDLAYDFAANLRQLSAPVYRLVIAQQENDRRDGDQARAQTRPKAGQQQVGRARSRHPGDFPGETCP